MSFILVLFVVEWLSKITVQKLKENLVAQRAIKLYGIGVEGVHYLKRQFSTMRILRHGKKEATLNSLVGTKRS